MTRTGLGSIWMFAAMVAPAVGIARARAADIPDYKNPDVPFQQRVADLLGRMTTAEKAEQVQIVIPANTRLGIPACNWWTEALHGLARPSVGTIFPDAIGMAASWDPALVHEVADAIGDEARAAYQPGVRGRGLMLWCPTLNMARDPRWGRTGETYGEDPYLAGRLAVAYVQGLQGSDPKYLKTVATPKHFAVHNQNTSRQSVDAAVSERALREYYLPAFQAAFVEGKAMSVMTAYNAINKVPCSANAWLLTDVLRGDWGFAGAVVSDSRAVDFLVSGHRLVDSQEKAVAAALQAGLDVISDTRPMGPTVLAALQSGALQPEVLDRAVTHSLLLRFRLGMFDPPERLPFKSTPAAAAGSKEHNELNLRMARESIVLLKNDVAPRGYGLERLLPLDLRRVRSVAVLGSSAAELQYGSYPGGSGRAGPVPVEALKAAVGDRVTVRTADYSDISGAVAAAAGSDLVIAVMSPGLEPGGTDRTSFELPIDRAIFLDRVLKANPLTVLVLAGGGNVGLERIKGRCPAILMTWYSGEQGGAALAETLLGLSNPAGRLPLTFYRLAEDLPPMNDYEPQHGRTYMYFPRPVSYAFGYGLSYTTFEYANLRLDPAAPRTLAPDGTLSVSVDVANSGPRDGDEVVQLYVHKPASAVYRPIKQLRGFQRVTIARGRTHTVTFHLSASDLAYWDETEHRWQVEAGRYEIMVGAASDDIRTRGVIEVK